MLQPIANPQPMYIPTRISPDVVASSRQLIPLGIVEQSGKSYYKFDTGDSWYKAVAYYPVSVIRSINQMSETEVNETEVEVVETVEAEPVSPTINIGVAEPEAQPDPAPVVEPVVDEVGAKIVRWYANNASDRQHAEKEIAALEAKGWIFRGMAAAGGSDEWDGEYSVLYVKPQAAVSS